MAALSRCRLQREKIIRWKPGFGFVTRFRQSSTRWKPASATLKSTPRVLISMILHASFLDFDVWVLAKHATHGSFINFHKCYRCTECTINGAKIDQNNPKLDRKKRKTQNLTQTFSSFSSEIFPEPVFGDRCFVET